MKKCFSLNMKAINVKAVLFFPDTFNWLQKSTRTYLVIPSPEYGVSSAENPSKNLQERVKTTRTNFLLSFLTIMTLAFSFFLLREWRPLNKLFILWGRLLHSPFQTPGSSFYLLGRGLQSGLLTNTLQSDCSINHNCLMCSLNCSELYEVFCRHSSILIDHTRKGGITNAKYNTKLN